MSSVRLTHFWWQEYPLEALIAGYAATLINGREKGMLTALFLTAAMAAGAQPLTICDPPKPDDPGCLSVYTAELRAARRHPSDVGGRALATMKKVERLKSPHWKPPAIGPKEAQLLTLRYWQQRDAMQAAMEAALRIAPAQLVGVPSWQPGQDFNPTGFKWQGMTLADQPIPAAELERQVKALPKVAFVGDALEFASQGPELNMPAWPLLGNLDMHKLTTLNNHVYTLTLIELLDKAATIPELQLKSHFKVPRPYDKASWKPEEVGDVEPKLPPPGNHSYPAGHASHATAVALVLAALGAGDEGALLKTVDAVADRRRMGRLHTQADNDAGKRLGRMIAAALLKEATTQDGPVRALLRKAQEAHDPGRAGSCAAPQGAGRTAWHVRLSACQRHQGSSSMP